MKSRSELPAKHIILFIYAVITLVTAFFHEPWRDEAQAWLLARDLSPLSLIKEMGYDGSPALWHFILMPFAKAGLPYFSMQLIHWVIALIAVGIFLYKSPFHLIFKILFIFSYYMLYEYAIIARSYVLSIFLLFSIATIYKDKLKMPLIYAILVFLLMNTNTHNFFPGVALFLIFVVVYYKEKRPLEGLKGLIIPALIMIAGMLIFFIQLIPPTDSWKAGLTNGFDWPWIFNAIGDAFMPSYLSNPGMTLFFKHWTELVFFTIFFVLLLVYLYKEPVPFFFFTFSVLGLFLIITFKHSGYLRHYGFILIYLVFALWTGEYGSFKDAFNFRINQQNIHDRLGGFICYFMVVCLCVTDIYGISSSIKEIRTKFSCAEEIAMFIKKQDVTEKEIVAYNLHTVTAVVPYLPGWKFWDPGLKAYYSYIHWNDKYLPSRKLSQENILLVVNTRMQENRTRLLLMPFPLSDAGLHGFTLIREADDNVSGDEKFYLYQREDITR